jgi:ABC-type transporter Mla subunit MlaD
MRSSRPRARAAAGERAGRRVSVLVPEPRLARRVGAVALLVLALGTAGFVFLLDRLALGSPTRIRVMFRHTAGLRDQAPLVVAGRPIGKVESITPVPHRAGGVLDGGAGVAVTVAIAPRDVWAVPARAEIIVASRGPLSDKYLEVVPPRGDPGPAIHDGQELRGVDPPSIDNVLQRSWANMTTFKLFAEAIRPELGELRAQLDRLRGQLAELSGDPRVTDDLAGLVAATRDLAAAARHTHESSLGGAPGLADLRATVDDARETLTDLRATLDRLAPHATSLAAGARRVRSHLVTQATLDRAATAVAAARAAVIRLDPLLANLGALADLIASGEGSLGRILRDPEFPEDAKDLGKAIKRQPWRILERPAD